MTSIQGCGHSQRECTSESSLRSLPFPKSNYDKALIGPPTIGLSKPSIAKYTEKDLQKILRTVLEAQAPPFDGPREKPLKAKSPNQYCGKSFMKCYNFYQKCKDYFTTVRAKGPNYILIALSFLRDRFNFY